MHPTMDSASSAVRSISTMKTQALLCPLRGRLSQYTDRIVMSFVARTKGSGLAVISCAGPQGGQIVAANGIDLVIFGLVFKIKIDSKVERIPSAAISLNHVRIYILLHFVHSTAATDNMHSALNSCLLLE